MEARDRPIPKWLNRVENSELALPRFQREESWDNKVRESFLTSVFRDLPVGVALILKSQDEPQFESRLLPNAPEGTEDISELLLDGQQRITCLWKAFNGEYDDRTYLLDLEEEELQIKGEKRYEKEGKEDLYPLWVDNPEACWDRKKVPVRILNPAENTSRKLRKWCKEASDEDNEELLDRLEKIKTKLTKFNIPYLYLPSETDPSTAVDVFIKLNTTNVDLSTFDIIVAQAEQAADESLHDKRDQLKEDVPDLEKYVDVEDYILEVNALIQDKMTSKSGFFDLDTEKMIESWAKMTEATEKTVNLLKQERIYDGKRLPSRQVLAPLSALFMDISEHPDERGNHRRLLRKYMWRAFLTNRYERSTNSRLFEDYEALKDVITENGNEDEVPCFDKNEHPLPEKDRIKAAGWPKKKNRLGRAILAISIKEGALNFADDQPLTAENIADREYHHVFPKDYLEDRDYEDKEIDLALNCALIHRKDNRNISNKKPLNYLKERTEADNLGEDKIERRLNSHLIDIEDMKSEDYEEFLDDRAEKVRLRMEKLFDGQSIR